MEPVSRIKNVQGIYAYSFSKDCQKKKRKIVVLEFILEMCICYGFLKYGMGKISVAVSIHVHIQCFVKIKKRIIFHAQLAINLVTFLASRVSMCPSQGTR